MLQRGGGKQYIGELTSEITSPASLDENCDVFYVSAHGATDFTRWMVVPENTFVIFIGFSGFATAVDHKAEWMIHDASRAKYFKRLYDTYFSPGENAKPRTYGSQHVYIPGDLLPDTFLDSTSEGQDYWAKGVFKCPVRDPIIFNIHAPENNYIFKLAEIVKAHDIPEVHFAIKNARPYNAEAWAEFVALSKEEKIRQLKEPYDKIRYPATWFANPEALYDLTDEAFTTDPDSLLKPIGHLSGFVGKSKIPTNKPYRCIIVSSCRPPINFLQDSAVFHIKRNQTEKVYGVPDPRNLLVTNTRRRLARRASFSGKPTEELCATRDDPPMNFTRAFSVYRTIDSATIQGKHERLFLHFLRLTDTNRAIPILVLADYLLNRLFYPFPLLTTDDESKQEARAAFTQLIDALKASFGAFMVGVHFDSKEETKRAQLLGRQLLEQAGYPDLEAPLGENEAAILASQKAFVEDPRWAALRAERTEAEMEALRQTRLRADLFTGTYKQNNRRNKTDKFDELRKELIDNLEKGEKLILSARFTPFYALNATVGILIHTKEWLESQLRDLHQLRDELDGIFTRAKEIFDAIPADVRFTKAGQAGLAESRFKMIKAGIERLNTLEKKIVALEQMQKPAPKPAKPASELPRNKTRNAPKPEWNEKELLKWRVEWLKGERNPKRDEARLKQWSAYRRTLTAAQRNAQNRNLTLRKNRA